VDVFSYGVVLCELLSRQAPAFKVFGRQPPSFAVDPAEIRSAQRAHLSPPADAFVVVTETHGGRPLYT
jgi:hypothetical protein